MNADGTETAAPPVRPVDHCRIEHRRRQQTRILSAFICVHPRL